MRAYSNQGTLTSTLEKLRERVSDQPKRQSSAKAPKAHALARRLTAVDREKIVAAYEGGASAKQLAADHQLAKGSILEILRTGGAAIRQQRRLSSEEIDQAVVSYQDGQSLATIADRLGVKATTVRAALERRGIPRRDSHGRPR
ncbi:helix-turn-helix domain containing protein [Nocardia concava]|uniref:helix-turn-helix domain containing protein n=1 Tax=Nocardia concava TaxID=257281 RepID=UPI0012FA365B|nr:helix-turn-helix domain containing protein [Nocardia concava]